MKYRLGRVLVPGQDALLQEDQVEQAPPQGGGPQATRPDRPQARRHPCIIFRDEHRRQKALWVLTLMAEHLVSRIDILTVVPDPKTAVRLVP